MRRADRLFRIIQILRSRSLTTAAQLAERLEVSERTIYRDVADLVASGVPIDGEAGVGYVLADGFDLPPIMFTGEEIETLALGARDVEQWGDAALAAAALSILEKVEAVLPADAKHRIEASRLFSVRFDASAEDGERLALLRDAAKKRRKIRFRYERRDGEQSERTVRPICLALLMSAWVLCAWCELRKDFRTFRLDRMAGVRALDETFDDDGRASLEEFLRSTGGGR